MPTAAQAALSITASPVTLVAFKPGSTSVSTAPSPIAIGAGILDHWVLNVQTATGARITRSTSAGLCPSGVSTLSSALHASYSALLPATTIVRSQYDIGSLSSAMIATGTTSDTVNVSYSQAVGASELMVAGCAYGMTLTYTVVAN